MTEQDRRLICEKLSALDEELIAAQDKARMRTKILAALLLLVAIAIFTAMITITQAPVLSLAAFFAAIFIFSRLMK